MERLRLQEHRAELNRGGVWSGHWSPSLLVFLFHPLYLLGVVLPGSNMSPAPRKGGAGRGTWGWHQCHQEAQQKARLAGRCRSTFSPSPPFLGPKCYEIPWGTGHSWSRSNRSGWTRGQIQRAHSPPRAAPPSKPKLSRRGPASSSSLPQGKHWESMHWGVREGKVHSQTKVTEQQFWGKPKFWETQSGRLKWA